VLRGRPRRETIEVDPRGQQVGAPVDVVKGAVGADVWLTIDSHVQRHGGRVATGHRIGAPAAEQNPDVTAQGYEALKAPAGSAWCSIPGRIRGRARELSHVYAELVVGGISPDHYNDLTKNPGKDTPLLNRAHKACTHPDRRSSS